MQMQKKQVSEEEKKSNLKSTPPSKNNTNSFQQHLLLSAKNRIASHTDTICRKNSDLSLSSAENGPQNRSKNREPTIVRFTIDNQEVIEVTVPNFLGSLATALPELVQLDSSNGQKDSQNVSMNNNGKPVHQTQSPFSLVTSTAAANQHTDSSLNQ